jgi:hypothetical protein
MPVRDRGVDELRVWHDHGNIIACYDNGAARANLLDCADDARHFDPISDSDRSFRQNDQTADEITDNVLQPETDTHSDCSSENRQCGQMNSSVLKDNENTDNQDNIADDLRNRVLERTIESTFSKDLIEKKTLRPRGNPKDGNQKCDQQKNLKNAESDCWKSRVPAQRNARRVDCADDEKMSAARLKIVVTIATNFVSILKRLKNRRTTWLCKILALRRPVAKRPANAIRPRIVT